MGSKSNRLRLSMVMIARDERDNVRPCFESFWDHVDEVVLCDTGSKDGTVAEARRFAKERGEPSKLIVGRFKWRDDFAAARTHAHSLASGEIHAWIDLDDRLQGASNIHTVVEAFGQRPDLAAINAWYELDPPVMFRRFLRSPVRWEFPTYERPSPVRGAVRGKLDVTTLVRWHHAEDGMHGRRDLDIALRWAKDSPTSWRPWCCAALEAWKQLDDFDLAAEYGERAIRLDTRREMPSQYRGQLLEIQAIIAADRGDHTRAKSLNGAAEVNYALRTLSDPLGWNGGSPGLPVHVLHRFAVAAARLTSSITAR